ncbi:MAG: insulinase family protein [Planctomycetes bacterium]|nr:insulinase family protein [Planctomycetota bacterium]
MNTMKYKKTVRTVVISILTLLTVMCGLRGNDCNSEDFDEEVSAMFQDTQNAFVFYLDNGMEVILVENHASPMITAFTVVKTGSRNEDASTNGCAHFLEHLLFNGTKSRTQKQLYDEMDFYGGYNNANTTTDYTNFMILMPKEYISQGMDIQADMLFNSVLPEEKFEKERGIVIEEIGKSENDMSHQVQNHYLRTFFANTPYERPVLGTVSTISHLKRDAVLEYYKTWYVPNNMTLMVIGDFITSEMIALVKEKYGKYPAGKLPERKNIQIDSPKKLRVVRANAVGNFSQERQYLSLGYVLPPPTDEDFQALQMMTEFLGGKDNSVLDELFHKEENKDLLYSISADMGFHREFSTLQISAELSANVDTDRVIDLIIQAIRDMASQPVPADELNTQLTSRLIQEIYLQEKLHYYAMMKSGYLAVGGYAFYKEYMEGIMSVTPQSIQKACQKYLKDQIPVITAMLPPVAASEETTQRSQSSYHKEVLPNGMTVVIKDNQDSRVVGIHLLAKERSMAEGKGKHGITEILQRMILEGGTRNYPKEGLNKAYEEIGAEIKLYDNPHIDFDDYYNSPRFAYVRLKVVDFYFEKGMKLLAETVIRPLLAQEPFAEAKKEVISLAARSESDIQDKVRRLFYENLFAEDTGFGCEIGFPDQLEKTSLEDVKALYQKMYNPANLILVVSGNVSVDKAMNIIKQNFEGEWGNVGWNVPVKNIALQENIGKTIRKKMGKAQSYISMGNTCEIQKNEMPALDILQYLFSNSLAFNLREKQGLAYSIGAGFSEYNNAHWYRITLGTRPENIDRAISGIKKEINDIRMKKFEKEEVQKAINAILGRRGMRRLDRVNQAYYISLEIFDGNLPEEDDLYPEKLKKVTSQEVEQLVQKVFQKDEHLVIIIE